MTNAHAKETFQNPVDNPEGKRQGPSPEQVERVTKTMSLLVNFIEDTKNNRPKVKAQVEALKRSQPADAA